MVDFVHFVEVVVQLDILIDQDIDN
jgi:hypothetical protein